MIDSDRGLRRLPRRLSPVVVLVVATTACASQPVAAPAQPVGRTVTSEDQIADKGPSGSDSQIDEDDAVDGDEADLGDERDGPCRGAAMTTLPLAEADIEVILPLGNLSPPGHTHPTDHLYYGLPYDESGQRLLVNVRAPGDGRVTSIDVSTKDAAGVVSFDYSLRVELCPDRTLKFGHVTQLSPPLHDALAGSEPAFCTEYGDSLARYEYCSYSTDVALGSGDPLGAAGGPMGTSAALDLWMYDTALAPNGLISTGDHSDVAYTRCALDYFTDELRDLQYGLLGGWNGARRTVDPVCGEIAQDRAGTAQGNWYADAEVSGEWDAHLALVHDNVDPGIAVIAVGGVIADPGLWSFRPEVDGLVNREFSEIVADDTVSCFHRFDDPPDLDRRFLVQLLDDDTLLVERQSGSCSHQPEFVDPTTYRRQPS